MEDLLTNDSPVSAETPRADDESNVAWTDDNNPRQAQEYPARLAAMLDAVGDMVQVIAPDGRFLFVNANCLEALGLAAADIRSLSFWDIVHPDELGHCREVITSVIKSEGALTAETAFLTRLGTRLEMECRICFQAGNAASGSAIVAICRDVSTRHRGDEEMRTHHQDLEKLAKERTQELDQAVSALRREVEERARAESKMQLANEELQQILTTVAGGLRVVDRDFNVVRVNDTLARMAEAPVSKLIGSKCYDFFPGEHCQQPTCTVRRVLNKEILVDVEVNKTTASGQTIPCLLNARALCDEHGEAVGVIEDFRDLRPTKRLQSIAEAVNTMNNIGYVFTGIRHELGNPVNSLKTTLGVLKRKLGTFSAETVAEYVDRSLNDVTRIEYLLRSLKSFSVYEHPTMEPLNVATFLRNLEPLVSRDMAMRGVAVKIVSPPETVWVSGDPRALQQVMLNLVTNAADACAATTDPLVTIAATRRGPYVEIIVADNGCGMSEQQRNQLFKPFYTTKANGTGLGLTIVKKMVAQIHGTVEVDSMVNVGTTVRILFPHLAGGWVDSDVHIAHH